MEMTVVTRCDQMRQLPDEGRTAKYMRIRTQIKARGRARAAMAGQSQNSTSANPIAQKPTGTGTNVVR